MPVAAKYLEVEERFAEELILVMPPDHPLAAKATIRISDVEPHPLVLLDEAHCLTGTIISFCRQRSLQPVAVARTSLLAMAQEPVSLGHGIWGVFDAAAAEFRRCHAERPSRESGEPVQKSMAIPQRFFRGWVSCVAAPGLSSAKAARAPTHRFKTGLVSWSQGLRQPHAGLERRPPIGRLRPSP